MSLYLGGTAATVYVGDAAATAVYLGDAEVWTSTPAGQVGAITATIAEPVAALAGAHKQAGAAASTLAEAAAALVGVQQSGGMMVSAAKKPVAALAGAHKQTGTQATILAKAASSLTGVQAPKGAIASTAAKTTAALSGVAEQPVTFDAAGTGAHAHATTITWAHTIASDATCLLVAVGEFVGSNPSLAQWVRSVKVGATQGSAVDLDSLGADYLNHVQGSNGILELWGLIDPPTGSMNIYVSYTYSTFTPYLNGGSVSYKGVTTFGSGFSATDLDWASSSAIKSHAMTSGGGHMVVGAQAIYNKTITSPSGTQRYRYPAGATANYATVIIQDAAGAQTVTPLTATASGSASWLSIAVDLVPETTPAQQDWIEEFTGSANSAPSSSNWAYDIGDGGGTGWGNNELQVYTNSTNNVYLDGSGNLVIKAIRAGSPGAYTYTSGRIKTLGKRNMGYGTVSASIKMPWGQGTWPAFWMLGTDDDVNLWPRCGEIDIIEYVNLRDDPDGFYWNLALHGPMSNPDNDYSPGVSASESIAWDPSGDFHTYAVTRTEDSIAFAIDGTTEWTATPASLPAGASWVFNDQPMYILINLAIGGDWAGDPNGTTTWPQVMTVAWVKYEPA